MYGTEGLQPRPAWFEECWLEVVAAFTFHSAVPPRVTLVPQELPFASVRRESDLVEWS